MTGTGPRKPHHHGALKEALIAFALDAARAGVVEQMSLREASRQLGVSPGAVYRHFPDKEALMRALALRGFDMLAAGFEAVAPLAAPPEDAAEAEARFRAMARVYVEFARDHFGLWRLMFGLAGAGLMPEGRPSAFAWLQAALEALSRQGVTRAAGAEAAHFAWASIHGLADLRAASGLAIPRDDAALAALCDHILCGLGAGGH